MASAADLTPPSSPLSGSRVVGAATFVRQNGSRELVAARATTAESDSLSKTEPLHDDESCVVEDRYLPLPVGEDLLAPEPLVRRPPAGRRLVGLTFRTSHTVIDRAQRQHLGPKDLDDRHRGASRVDDRLQLPRCWRLLAISLPIDKQR